MPYRLYDNIKVTFSTELQKIKKTMDTPQIEIIFNDTTFRLTFRLTSRNFLSIKVASIYVVSIVVLFLKCLTPRVHYSN